MGQKRNKYSLNQLLLIKASIQSLTPNILVVNPHFLKKILIQVKEVFRLKNQGLKIIKELKLQFQVKSHLKNSN